MISKGKISELIKNLTLVHPPEVNSTFSSSLLDSNKLGLNISLDKTRAIPTYKLLVNPTTVLTYRPRYTGNAP